MAQVTLLDVVQRYLNSVDSWDVDSIEDTVESRQVALIAVEVLERLIQDTNYSQHTSKVTTLNSSTDPTKPNYLVIPDDVQRISESRIQYNSFSENDNATVKYKDIKYLQPHEFLEYVGVRSDASSNTEVIEDYSGTKFSVVINSSPEYCTSFDGKFIVFDAYDKDVDDTLQSYKSRVIYSAEPDIIMEDGFIIPLPSHMTQGYIDMVKAEASEVLRQEPLPSAARRARKFLIKQRQIEERIGNHPSKTKKYGRHSGGS